MRLNRLIRDFHKYIGLLSTLTGLYLWFWPKIRKIIQKGG